MMKELIIRRKPTKNGWQEGWEVGWDGMHGLGFKSLMVGKSERVIRGSRNGKNPILAVAEFILSDQQILYCTYLYCMSEVTSTTLYTCALCLFP